MLLESIPNIGVKFCLSNLIKGVYLSNLTIPWDATKMLCLLRIERREWVIRLKAYSIYKKWSELLQMVIELILNPSVDFCSPMGHKEDVVST